MSAESFDEAKSDRDKGSWAELAEAACEGNREARNELYTLARPAIHGLGWRARRYLRNASYGYTEPPVTPEDIDQQAFIVFCELLESWPQGDEEFRAYMHRKLPGRLMHYVRASLEHGRTRLYSQPATHESETGGEEPEKIEETSWSAVSQRLHLDGLPYRQRVALMMRYRDDLPSTQIGLVTGKTRRTVNRDLKEALDHLRAELHEGWEHTG